MEPITISFNPTSLGRVEFDAEVMTGNRLSLDTVTFKLDTGSDFTTLSCKDLRFLGYTDEYLKACKYHEYPATPAGSSDIHLQYIENIVIKFGNRELQGCRIFFLYTDAQEDVDRTKPRLRSYFGSDILKYFNYEVNYDKGELCLKQVKTAPALSAGETPIHIYALEDIDFDEITQEINKNNLSVADKKILRFVSVNGSIHVEEDNFRFDIYPHIELNRDMLNSLVDRGYLRYSNNIYSILDYCE